MTRRFSPPPWQVPPEVANYKEVMRKTQEERDAALARTAEKAAAAINAAKDPPPKLPG